MLMARRLWWSIKGITTFRGGGSKPGESLEISLARELREEFSWQIPVDKRLWSAIQYVVADGGIHYELRPTYF